MKRPRRNHSAEFKVRIAWGMARGVESVVELSPESAVIVGDTVFQHPVESVLLLLSVKAGQRSERCVPCLESGSSR